MNTKRFLATAAMTAGLGNRARRHRERGTRERRLLGMRR